MTEQQYDALEEGDIICSGIGWPWIITTIGDGYIKARPLVDADWSDYHGKPYSGPTAWERSEVIETFDAVFCSMVS